MGGAWGTGEELEKGKEGKKEKWAQYGCKCSYMKSSMKFKITVN